MSSTIKVIRPDGMGLPIKFYDGTLNEYTSHIDDGHFFVKRRTREDQNDPNEFHNLVAEGAHKKTAEELHSSHLLRHPCILQA